ncbi:MAG: hypothetical protein ABJC51_05275 [Acidobacteriota bacterium]
MRALQSELAALRAAGAPATPGPAPQLVLPPQAEPSASAPPAAVGADAPTAQNLPVYAGASSKPFNPDIGIIGNFLSAGGVSRGGSSALAPVPLMTLQESEASFQAVVDPYARADFFLALGEEGIEVEEGFITFPTAPGGLLIKVGKMRATFGRLNAFHNHTLPWTDRPLVMYNLLGGASDDPDTGIKDAGVSVSRLIPVGKLFLEATGEVFRGDSGTLFQSNRRQDFSTIGHLRAYTDLTEGSNLEMGASFARGHNDLGTGLTTRLYGADVTYRWKPLTRAIYRSFVGRSELMWSRRDQPMGVAQAFGTFVSGDYQFARRWVAGGRFDSAERGREVNVRDRGWSAVLTFWPSEFSQLRSQYRRTRFGDRDEVAHELFLQVLFTIGAHGAHAF